MALFSKFPSRLLSRFLLVLPCQLEYWNPTKFSCSRHQGLPEKRVRVQLYLCIWSTGVAQNGCTFFLGTEEVYTSSVPHKKYHPFFGTVFGHSNGPTRNLNIQPKAPCSCPGMCIVPTSIPLKLKA